MRICPTQSQPLYSTQFLIILPFIYLGAIYTGRRIVNSITACGDVSAQGAPRESRTERLSPKPPRSTANSSVISEQTGPARGLISHARYVLATGDVRRAHTSSGHLYPYPNPDSEPKPSRIPRSDCDFAAQNSVSLSRWTVRVKATRAGLVTLAALRRWIFILLFIAGMIFYAEVILLHCLSISVNPGFLVSRSRFTFYQGLESTVVG